MKRWAGGAQAGTREGLAVASLLSVFAFAVQGFHPYAEDGGLYVAGIERRLDPGLFAARPEFVEAPMHISLFAPIVASLVRGTHLPLPWMLVLLYLAGIGLTLFAAWMMASRCVETLAGRAGAVALLACSLTLPIAGTSLILMDPYVTARSMSTPLVLLALAWAMDALRGIAVRWGWSASALLLAATVHPLMAGYGLAAVLVLAVAGSWHAGVRRVGPWALGALALLLAALVEARAPAESSDYTLVAMTRPYWFPFRWEWYEQVGLIAPLLLLVWLARTLPPTREHATWRRLARAALVLGLISLAVACVFSRTQTGAGVGTHLVARLQPLRAFQIVYEIMIVLLGAWLGERWLGAQPWRWGVLLAVLGGVFFTVQRQTYPASDHLEMPWRVPSNRWEQAFLWVRGNTPRDAVFALDARYITRGRGEDAQCFRAIAERSALPDYSKDGGEAAIAPQLTETWMEGQRAQSGLEHEDDAARERLLRPLGAGWAVLEVDSPTAWDCAYRNAAVKVCRLP